MDKFIDIIIKLTLFAINIVLAVGVIPLAVVGGFIYGLTTPQHKKGGVTVLQLAPSVVKQAR